ncbi:MAG: VOC family protein [Chloroflexota bacterium]
MSGNFVWADLSTFDLLGADNFYRAVFNWETDSLDKSGYNICYAGRQPAAGLYVMPEFFQSINMPSFWMSYIQVENIHAVADKASELGGKVELGPEPMGDGSDGQIALIRDPLGAGFTIYEGSALNSRDTNGGHGRMAWNELIISDISKILPFYETLFRWKITRLGNSKRFDITNSQNELIANIEEIPNEIKGKLEFWGVYFTVADLDQAADAVQRSGGQITYDNQTSGSRQLMCTDPQGAAFLITQGDALSTGSWFSGFKWRSWLGLLFIFVAVVFNWTLFWSLLFLLWIVPDLINGVTYFLEPVQRREHPVLYWSILSIWIVLAVYPVFELFQVI